MFAIGNNELDQLEPIGKKTKCPKCGKQHEVKYAEKVNTDGTKEPCDLLGFVDCGKKSYLVAVKGMRLK